MQKKCSKCGEVKAVSEFTRDKTKKDGLYSSCKRCTKEYYLNNREKLLKNMRQRSKTLKYKENRKKYESQPEVKAKIKKYDFNKLELIHLKSIVNILNEGQNKAK